MAIVVIHPIVLFSMKSHFCTILDYSIPFLVCARRKTLLFFPFPLRKHTSVTVFPARFSGCIERLCVVCVR